MNPNAAGSGRVIELLWCSLNFKLSERCFCFDVFCEVVDWESLVYVEVIRVRLWRTHSWVVQAILGIGNEDNLSFVALVDVLE